jgi:hypothetical protein
MLLRGLMNMYTSRIEQRARGNRMVRESAALRGAEGVWADVASATGLGFRWSEQGPLLYGELGRAEFEAGIYEWKEDGSYRTMILARGSDETKGKLIVSPRTAAARLFGVVMKPPPLREGLDPEFAAAFFVRAQPPELAASLLSPGIAAALLDVRDRAPVLEWKDGSSHVLLEGIELVQERFEALLRAMGALAPQADAQGPYRKNA